MNEESIIWMNTPARLERIDKFKVSVKIKQINSQNVVTFVCSEPIVTKYNALSKASALVQRESLKTDSPSLVIISKSITDYFQFLLTYCRACFGDESDSDLFVGDEQVLRVEETGLTIHDLMNG
jgi:hypothetical protein